MTSFSLISSPPVPLKTCFLPSIRTIHSRRYNHLKLLLTTSTKRRRFRSGRCTAELTADTPVAIAIGACILNSLVFQLPPSQEDLEAESLIDSADARFAVMGIISFIPYFNWMSWVFAWMDTGRQRYAVYAIVYLAPYLRSNLSISPDDSWLPIASILLCILHIQLEVSIKNGDLQNFQIFKSFSPIASKKNKQSFKEEERKDFENLPPSREEYKDELRDWIAPQKPHKDLEILNEDEEDN